MIRIRVQVCLHGLNLGPARLIFYLAGFLRAVQLLCSAAKGTGQVIELGVAAAFWLACPGQARVLQSYSLSVSLMLVQLSKLCTTWSGCRGKCTRDQSIILVLGVMYRHSGMLSGGSSRNVSFRTMSELLVCVSLGTPGALAAALPSSTFFCFDYFASALFLW